MKKLQKEQKRKPKYGLFSCVSYMYRYLWRNERRLVFHGVFIVPVSLLAAAVTLYTPSLILKVLEEATTFNYVALVIAGLLLVGFLTEFINTLLDMWKEPNEMYVTFQLMYLQFENRRNRDWYHQYSEEVQKLNERGSKAIENNHTAGVHFPMDFAEIIATVFKFLLFGGVVSVLHPVIVVLLICGCMISYGMGIWERKANYNQRDYLYVADKRRRYLNEKLSGNFKFGKDIRLYQMQMFLHELNRKSLLECQKQVNIKEHRSFMTAFVSFLVVLVRDGLAYGFLIFKAAAGEVDAALFVLYFSAITALSEYMTEILNSWSKISEGTLQISDFRESMEITNRLNSGTGIPVPKNPFSIEFKDVSYRYPMGEKQILDHVSFRINAGEKIALVGLNGAGKTTLTMLMCGLLIPDEGEVLIDGHSVFEYNRDELYEAFGLIPQNYNLLPVSIGRNIACAMTEEEIDRKKLWHCIETAGLADKIKNLPNKEYTPLYREVFEEAIDLSGGEKQKLLLARLLYKNPPCMILDEPTAALDPIAESRMYEKYSEITADATSVFISHRLASTRFCDRIFLLDGADFAEEGTHEELMASGKTYRKLFDVQSKYYKDGGADNGE
ncbi:ABC transporter ATP-binding protein [Faecalicatena sp. Marseille-Q4148]|nr:ABC transporter ATP-binding protein [Faecalicatena sp. Marseille-Q4148]